MEVPAREKRRSTGWRQTPPSNCASSSPSTSCSVKFLEPTVSSLLRGMQPAAQRRASPDRKARRSISVNPADHQLFEAAQEQVRRQGHQSRGDGTGQNHSVVHHGDAAEDELAQSARADGCRDGRNADGNHGSHANSCQHHRQRQREFHMPEQLARSKSHGSGSSNPKSARLGMVWTTFVLPSTNAFHFGWRVSSIPSGTPMRMASSIEIPTSHRCSAVRVATSRLWVSRKFTRSHAPLARQSPGGRDRPPMIRMPTREDTSAGKPQCYHAGLATMAEERRVGKEWRSRWSPYH